MKSKTAIAIIILLLQMVLVNLISHAQVPLPSAAQLAWQDAELCIVFHYDLHVFDGKKYSQSANRITPIEDYNIFNPTQLNTDQWIQSAKAAGAKYAILTITHETGFALYQSDVNPYCMKALKWKDGKGDILRDFVNSCNKYGIKPGIYIGIRWNSFLGVHDFMMQGETPFSKNRQSWYNHYCEQMTTELLTRYGKLFFIWFDGGAHGPEQGGPDILPIAEKYQPGAIFYHNLQRADIRWGGTESGTVSYPCWSTFGYPSWFQHNGATDNFNAIKYGDENGKYYMPAMADAPLRGYKGRHEWFWEPGDEDHIYPVQKLMDMYYNSAGHNATLILGVTPNADGLVPQQDADTLKAFGDSIRNQFSHAIATTAGEGNEFTLANLSGKWFNKILIAEHIEKGDRVRAFKVQAWRKHTWETITEGTAVGHKFIKLLPAAITAQKIRLVIDKSIATPSIKQFSLY